MVHDPPFQTQQCRLRQASGEDLIMEPLRQRDAEYLANSVAAIEPWRTLHRGAADLLVYLTEVDPHSHRWVALRNRQHVGIVGIRSPWLYGPYIALLAVLPGNQRQGIGSGILGWIEAEVRRTAKNIWVCASSFNSQREPSM